MRDNEITVLLLLTIPAGLAAAYFAYHQLFVFGMSYFHRFQIKEEIIGRTALADHLAQAEQQLFDLGFTFLEVNACTFHLHNEPICEWRYTHENGVIYGCLVPLDISETIHFQIHFYTVFTDRSMIITRYPIGEDVHTPRLVSRFTRESITAAFDQHLQQLAEWELSSKLSPFPVLTHEDIQYLDTIYREDHKRRVMRDLYATLFLQGVLLVITSVASFAVSAAVFEPNYTVINWGILIAITAFALMIYSTDTNTKRVRAIENQKRKKA